MTLLAILLPHLSIMLRSTKSFLFDKPFLSMKKITRTMPHALLAITGSADPL